MQRRFGSILLVATALATGGCANSGWSTNTPRGTTTIAMIGRPGATVDGSYVQDGRRLQFSAVLPVSITRTGLSEFQVVKKSPEEDLVLAAQTDDRGWHSEAISQAGADVVGLEVQVNKGISVERLVP